MWLGVLHVKGKKRDIRSQEVCCNPYLYSFWKWDHITIDFVVGMPQTQKHHDVIWVVINRLTNSAHFLAMRITFNVEQLEELCIKEIVRLHRIPLLIVSDRDTKFASKFW